MLQTNPSTQRADQIASSQKRGGGADLRIVRIHIENFRGISLADLHFNGTSVFLGDNNTGKSTVFEAIELAIGADRLSRTQAIDEHDFHGGRYLAEGDQPQPKIIIEVVIAGLDEQHCTKFRNGLEFWRTTDRTLLVPAHLPGPVPQTIEPPRPILFHGPSPPTNSDFLA